MFNGLAKLLSVGFIGSIDRHAERGSANGSKSSQQCVDPRDVDATGLQNNVYCMLAHFVERLCGLFFSVCINTLSSLRVGEWTRGRILKLWKFFSLLNLDKILRFLPTF